MPPVITREYRIPTDIDKTGNTNVGPQLQAIANDAAKFRDGTRLIWPDDGNFRTDPGLRIPARKNFVIDWNGSKLTTPVDVGIGATLHGCKVEPSTPGSKTGTEVTTTATLPSFQSELWYAQAAGFPSQTRCSRTDAYHAHLSKPVPVGTATVTFISPRDRSRTLLVVSDCEHFEINNYVGVGSNEQGGRSDGAWNVNFEAQHGLLIEGSIDGKIAAPDISYVGGDCIATSRSPNTGRLCSGIEIVDYYLHHNGRSGITPKGIVDSSFQGKQREIRHNCINMEPADAKDTTRRVRFHDSDLGAYRFGWFAAHPLNNVAAILGDITVDNMLLGTVHLGIVPGTGVRWGPFSMTRLTARAPEGNPFGYAIGVERVDGWKLRDSTLMLQAGRNMRGGRSIHCTDVDVGGNDWADGIGEWRDFP